jgi:DnaK suppressor protein
MRATATKSTKKPDSAKKETNAAVVGAAGKVKENASLKPASKATGVARKTAPATKKPAAKPATETPAKPAVKSRIPAKKSSGSSRSGGTMPEEKSSKTVTKARPAKQAEAPVAPPTKTAATRKARTKSEVTRANSPPAKADAPMSTNKATAHFVANIQESEVSKVNEVATKTMKPTPAAPEDGTLLTEAQILKMGEKDYMNEAQLAFFKARLQQLEKDLLKNAGETTEHLRETVLVPDPADRATIEEEHALELRTRDRERKLLKKVQQSLASIESGEYGWCEETGEPIGIPRLLARPTATLSLEAQQRRELKQKLYGD